MFRTTAVAIAIAAVSAPAFAGSIAPPAPQPVVAVPVPAPVAAPRQTADWGGFYAGATLGYGDVTAEVGGTEYPDDIDGAMYGLFAGYNHDFGSIVLGGELGYQMTDIEAAGVEGDGILSARARLGYDAGRFLPYVTAGWAQLSTTGVVDDKDTGSLYGIGFDYQLTDSIRLGAEATRHQFDDFADSGVDITADNLALRVSFAF